MKFPAATESSGFAGALESFFAFSSSTSADKEEAAITSLSTLLSLFLRKNILRLMVNLLEFIAAIVYFSDDDVSRALIHQIKVLKFT